MSRKGRFSCTRAALVPSRQSTVRLQHRAATGRPPQTVEHHDARRRRVHLLRVERGRLNVGHRAHRGAVDACDHYHPETRNLTNETRRPGASDVQREWTPAAQRSLEQTRERIDRVVSRPRYSHAIF